MQDHVTHLEILREEIDLVTNRKNDLEKKVHQLITERESLSTALDESADKILMLEKHTREQDCQVRAVQTTKYSGVPIKRACSHQIFWLIFQPARP